MKTLVVGIVAAVVLSLSGCAALSDEQASDDGVAVAAAFYPLQYVAERVAGNLASVNNLTSPGTEPHDLELSIRETSEVAKADLVIYERTFQPAVDDAIDENAAGAELDVAEIVELRPDEHGDSDPHFWLDPLLLAEVGDAVAVELGQVDPDHAAAYSDRAAALRSDLEALDAAYDAGLADCDRSIVVVSHDAFAYLGRYGLEFEPIAGLSPDAEPTPADLGRLQALIEEQGITTVFGERLVSASLSETLAEDMGITTAVLDPIEGLADETKEEDYLSLMEQNLAALEAANGCP